MVQPIGMTRGASRRNPYAWLERDSEEDVYAQLRNMEIGGKYIPNYLWRYDNPGWGSKMQPGGQSPMPSYYNDPKYQRKRLGMGPASAPAPRPSLQGLAKDMPLTSQEWGRRQGGGWVGQRRPTSIFVPGGGKPGWQETHAAEAKKMGVSYWQLLAAKKERGDFGDYA